jgi:predicted CXXCH cytochrome family protein
MAARTTSRQRVVPGVALMLVLAAAGCSSETSYEVLSFFFDGVPDPNHQDEPVTQAVVRRSPSGTTFFVHKPFFDGDCSACHKGEVTALVSAASVPTDICLECHTSVLQQYPVMHGPVAAMACDQCHNPHRSTTQHLLRAAPRDLCLQCHSQNELRRSILEHHDNESSCITCHSGHGGADRDMLRPAIITGRPVIPRAAAEGGGEQ